MSDYKAGRDYIIVKIDKKKQREKQEKTGSIYLPPKFLYMLYNLQYGEILSIGIGAQHVFPEMKVGDMAVFHHSIEDEIGLCIHYDMSTDKDGNTVIDYEYRMVNITKDISRNLIYGVISPTGYLTPGEDYVFLHYKSETIEAEIKSDLLQTVDASFWKSEEKMLQAIAEADHRINDLQNGLRLAKDIQRRVDIKHEIDYLYKEKTSISEYMNSTRFTKSTILHINPKTQKLLGIDIANKVLVRKDLFYPINVLGYSFSIVKYKYILAFFKN